MPFMVILYHIAHSAKTGSLAVSRDTGTENPSLQQTDTGFCREGKKGEIFVCSFVYSMTMTLTPSGIAVTVACELPKISSASLIASSRLCAGIMCKSRTS